MPMWKIYHPEHTLSSEEQQQIAVKVTAMYSSFLPQFYVNVFFEQLTTGSCYIGGERRQDFVRVTIDHIARSIKSAEAQQQFLAGCSQILTPYLEKYGLAWELHVNETSFELWTINGFKPPLPGTEAEQKWRTENKPSAY